MFGRVGLIEMALLVVVMAVMPAPAFVKMAVVASLAGLH